MSVSMSAPTAQTATRRRMVGSTSTGGGTAIGRTADRRERGGKRAVLRFCWAIQYCTPTACSRHTAVRTQRNTYICTIEHPTQRSPTETETTCVRVFGVENKLFYYQAAQATFLSMHTYLATDNQAGATWRCTRADDWATHTSIILHKAT